MRGAAACSKEIPYLGSHRRILSQVLGRLYGRHGITPEPRVAEGLYLAGYRRSISRPCSGETRSNADLTWNLGSD
jgi:hypothetical protein